MRHYKHTLVSCFSNPIPKPRPSSCSQILDLCKSGSFFDALTLLNTINSDHLVKLKQPLIYASLLQTAAKFGCFRHALPLHSFSIKSGLIANPLVANSLLSFYFKFDSTLVLPTQLFKDFVLSSTNVLDVISWTSLISGYVKINPHLSLYYFWAMLDYGFRVDAFTLSAAIKACSQIGDVDLGRCFHGAVYRFGFHFNHVISSTLVHMYGNGKGKDNSKNFCWLKYARNVFDQISKPDSVCWSSIISASTKNDLYEDALTYFYAMQREFKPVVLDEFVYASVVTSCGNLARLKQGKQVHARVIIQGLSGNVELDGSLVDMYGKCGQVEDAQRIFDRMPKRNLVSWCALLNGYCQNGLFESVIKLFRMMEGPDFYSFGILIRACASLADARHGKEIHCQYVRKGGRGHVIIESALIHLYAKSGCIDYARRLFMQMPDKNLISWNSMICAFAQNGRGLEAIELFYKMIKESVRPDYISFLGIIFACSHSGFVDKGLEIFKSMTVEFGIEPGPEHCNCMVVLLGRSGLIDEAENLIENVNYKYSFSLWSALLGACTIKRNSATVERIALKMMEIEPNNHLSYVHLINVYKSDGRWNDAMKIRKLMEDRGAQKLPGRSLVDNAFGFLQNKDSFIGGINLVP